MGKFIYENAIRVDFDDRVLTHLMVVIGSKLRRGEAFHLSWKDDPSIGNGRTTVWIHPGSSLVYKFYGSRRPAVNRMWIEALLYTANSSTGLYIVPEPPEPAEPPEPTEPPEPAERAEYTERPDQAHGQANTDEAN